MVIDKRSTDAIVIWLKNETIKMLDEIVEEFQFPSRGFAIEMIIAEYHETEVPKHKRWKEKMNSISGKTNKGGSNEH